MNEANDNLLFKIFNVFENALNLSTLHENFKYLFTQPNTSNRSGRAENSTEIK